MLTISNINYYTLFSYSLKKYTGVIFWIYDFFLDFLSTCSRLGHEHVHVHVLVYSTVSCSAVGMHMIFEIIDVDT